MSKVKNFELGAILTMTTGFSCIDDFDKVWELIWYVCDDNMIGPMGICFVRDDIKDHLLSIHPELEDVKYEKGMNIYKFVTEQEEKFGKFLPVTKLGVKLPSKDLIKKL